MSGPITTSYVYLPPPPPTLSEALLEHLTPAVYGAGAVVLALQALREAKISYDQYQQVLAQAQRDAQAQAERVAQACSARITQRRLWLQQHEELSAQIQRLRRLLVSLDAQVEAELIAQEPPAQPQRADESQWAAHLQTLARLQTRLQSALAQVEYHSRAALNLPEEPGHAPRLPDLLHSYAMEQALRARLPAQTQSHYQQEVVRILSRLHPELGDTVPPLLEALGARVLLAPSVERAEALLSELRLAVQRAHETQQQRQLARQQALDWLIQLGTQAPTELTGALEAVAAGLRELDDGLRLSAETQLAQVHEEHRRLQDQAAAVVLAQSLRDLGYEVSDVSDTLFTEGGLLHFQRQGWDNYFVRLRVDAQEQQINFNVVRPPSEADGTSTIRQQDTLAEDRWCREFPQLMDTLAARGLQLAVTRRLEAGQLPVQVVAPASLPSWASEDQAPATEQRAPLRQRPLN